MGNYLAEWLATIAVLVDKSMPVVVALLMPSQEAKEESGEGCPGPSYLMSPMGLPAESR